MWNQSPLEILASYAITFVAGAVSVVAISAYGKWMRHQGRLPVSVTHGSFGA